MGVTFEKRDYIWLIYDGNGVEGQIGFRKIYCTLVFISVSGISLGVKFLVWKK